MLSYHEAIAMLCRELLIIAACWTF